MNLFTEKKNYIQSCCIRISRWNTSMSLPLKQLVIVSLIVIKKQEQTYPHGRHFRCSHFICWWSASDCFIVEKNKLNRMSIVIRQVDSKDNEPGLGVESFSSKAARALRFCDSKHAIWSRLLFSGVLNHMLGEAINFWSELSQ